MLSFSLMEFSLQPEIANSRPTRQVCKRDRLSATCLTAKGISLAETTCR